MKVRHYCVDNEVESKCPVTGQKATLIFGSGSLRNPDIIVEREYQEEFTIYHVILRGKRLTQEECLLTFIGKTRGIQTIELSLYSS
jgi:hypothetical protein